jgi:hypothetical protein
LLSSGLGRDAADQVIRVCLIHAGHDNSQPAPMIQETHRLIVPSGAGWSRAGDEIFDGAAGAAAAVLQEHQPQVALRRRGRPAEHRMEVRRERGEECRIIQRPDFSDRSS